MNFLWRPSSFALSLLPIYKHNRTQHCSTIELQANRFDAIQDHSPRPCLPGTQATTERPSIPSSTSEFPFQSNRNPGIRCSSSSGTNFPRHYLFCAQSHGFGRFGPRFRIKFTTQTAIRRRDDWHSQTEEEEGCACDRGRRKERVSGVSWIKFAAKREDA